MNQVGSTSLTERFRGFLEILSSLAFVAVAGVIVWRLIGGVPIGPQPAARQPAAARAEPPLPSDPISLDGAATKGRSTAKVAIVAFSDFQCPYCAAFAREIWPALDERYVATGQALFAFRHLPLDSIHPMARKAAEAAECARRQDAFWPMHDAIFSEQKALVGTDFGALASVLRLDGPRFAQCLASEAQQDVAADSKGAGFLGISGTPTFLIGYRGADGRVAVTGRIVGAKPVEEFGKLIEAAAKKAS